MLIDIFFVIMIIIAIVKGYQRGLIVAIFSILAFIIGLAAALKCSAVVAGWLKDSVNVSAKWLPVLSFVLVFLGVALVVRWGAAVVEKTFQVAMLGWLNRLGGMILYASLYLIIFSVFLFYAERLKFTEPATIKASATYHFIQPWGPRAIDGFGRLIPVFKDTFTDLENFFGGLAAKVS